MTDTMLDHLPAAIKAWQETDPQLAALAQEVEIPEWPRGEDPFESLATAIVHQQISLAAGRTIWGRVEAATGGTPQGFMALGEGGLREAGVSRMKAGYILDLASKVTSGELDLDGMHDMSDEEATVHLTAVKGIGTWSAKMHLLFFLGRLDICPFEDLGVRLAVEKFYGVPEKEAAAWLKVKQADWSPYNSLAARVLWNARRMD